MTIGPPILCALCRYKRTGEDDKVVCDVFPEGIPAEILTMQHDHREPHPADDGRQFEPLEGAPTFEEWLGLPPRKEPRAPVT